MKANLRLAVLGFCIALVCFGAAVSNAQIMSNGTGGGDWNTGSTWIGNTVPISTDNVIVQGTDVITMVAAGSCATLTLQAGTTLSLNAASLTIPGSTRTFDAASTVIYNGTTTVQSAVTYGNLTYATSSNGQCDGSMTVNGNLNITAGTLRGNAGTSGSFVHAIAGNVVIGPGASARITAVNNSSATSGSCTWNIHGNVSLTGAVNTNRMILFESAGPHTGSSIFNIDGNINVSAGSQIQIRSSTSATANACQGAINLKGNIVNSGRSAITSSSGGTGTLFALNLVGTSPQTWTGVFPNTFPAGQSCNIQVNNATGVTLASADTLNGNDSLTLVSGLLTTTNTNFLAVSATAGAAIVGGSASSFVNGPLVQIWSTATATKIYPLGKGATYRPLEIALTTPQSPALRAEVFNVNAGGTSALNAISTVRYYQTSLLSGTAVSGGTAKITYGADDGVSDFSQLVVANCTTVNGVYLSLGGTGDATSVTTVTAYDPGGGSFLLIGSNGTNALPVELTSFTGTPNGRTIELRWTTATETNNTGFEVQKNINGTWTKIGFVAGAGTSTAPKSYSFTDVSNVAATYSYRLMQIDRNGAVSYGRTIEATAALTAEDFNLSQNYPNPFNPSTKFSFAMKNAEQTTVKVFNVVGSEVATLFNEVAQPNKVYTLTYDAKNLPSGMYFYVLRSQSRNDVKKMMLLK